MIHIMFSNWLPRGWTNDKRLMNYYFDRYVYKWKPEENIEFVVQFNGFFSQTFLCRCGTNFNFKPNHIHVGRRTFKHVIHFHLFSFIFSRKIGCFELDASLSTTDSFSAIKIRSKSSNNTSRFTRLETQNICIPIDSIYSSHRIPKSINHQIENWFKSICQRFSWFIRFWQVRVSFVIYFPLLILFISHLFMSFYFRSNFVYCKRY